MDFDSLDSVVGKVISEMPYVKVLTKPRQVDGRWQAVAQVDTMLAIIAVTVTPKVQP